MATIVLQYAGAGLGGLIGGPVGAMLGRAAGALAGSLVDSKLFGGRRAAKGPRLDDLRVMASSEGAPIPVMWGRARLSGQVIWASDLEEVIVTSDANTGSKGMDGGARVTEYNYFASFAVGLCQGEIACLGRVWADGKEVDLSDIAFRLYKGSETQMPDSLILAHEGDGQAPAYRGLAYVVFERLSLARFGNRIPQLSFEITRAPGDIENRIASVAIIPGATEFGYDPEPVTRDLGRGGSAPENTHAAAGASDWTRSLDELNDLCPNLASAALTVAWFGSDLRCGECLIEPKVDDLTKRTRPHDWSVGGLSRSSARETSRTADGNAAFGGTPSDSSVLRAIADLKGRGLAVLFYPFLLMDIHSANALPDPYSDQPSQPAYPWRGRVTCRIAPGRTGSPDKTSAVAAEIASFFGAAAPGDFRLGAGRVEYDGPDEWSYRRFILHYAKLCALSGGVDAFILGSELKGLTTLRASADEFPAVDELLRLAAEVKAILPSAKISYGADWSEYFGHHPQDGSGDVYFHLDPLWASPAIDFIAIDNYFPLSDWRDGASHLDRLAGFASGSGLAYLKANVEGGELYGWHYPDAAHRDAQARVPIEDGAHGKPWVYRRKDLRGWWSNVHFDRPGGVEKASSTAWVPQSKPIWFTELGCPAVDKGAGEPNRFHDAKSSDSALPHYSAGHRDDFIQRRYIEAVLSHWRAEDGRNPISSVYGGPMVDASRIFLWAWDARPFPHFPGLPGIWADSSNYELGHWLNGRLGSVPLGRLAAAILAHFGFADADTEELDGMVDGYVIDDIMSARDAIEPLASAFAFDVVESAGRLRFLARRNTLFTPLEAQACLDQAVDKPLVTLTRAQETDLPASVRLAYAETGRDYRQAVVESQRLTGSSRRETLIALPAMLSQGVAQGLADALLFDAWNSREKAAFSLPPSCLRFEPGDGVALSHEGLSLPLRIEEVQESYGRAVKARQLDSALFGGGAGAARQSQAVGATVWGPPEIALLDLPLLTTSAREHGLWLAACADPWPGGLAVYRRRGGRFDLNRTLASPAVMGETLSSLAKGPLWRRDLGNRLTLRLFRGALESISGPELLNGGNIAAVGNHATGFEIIQFEQANLIAPSTYEISGLLRGQLGSSPEMLPERSLGSLFILLDKSVVQLDMSAADLGLTTAWRSGPASRPPGDDSYREDVVIPLGRALRPLPPCNLRARRLADGDLRIAWIRQTRIDGDNWELAEVPLGESSERYVVQILEEGDVKREVTVDAPVHLYALADQLADFGAPPNALSVRISQLSIAYGPGAATEMTLDV
jgi:hypothetical protein